MWRDDYDVEEINRAIDDAKNTLEKTERIIKKAFWGMIIGTIIGLIFGWTYGKNFCEVYGIYAIFYGGIYGIIFGYFFVRVNWGRSKAIYGAIIVAILNVVFSWFYAINLGGVIGAIIGLIFGTIYGGVVEKTLKMRHIVFIGAIVGFILGTISIFIISWFFNKKIEEFAEVISGVAVMGLILSLIGIGIGWYLKLTYGIYFGSIIGNIIGMIIGWYLGLTYGYIFIPIAGGFIGFILGAVIGKAILEYFREPFSSFIAVIDFIIIIVGIILGVYLAWNYGTIYKKNFTILIAGFFGMLLLWSLVAYYGDFKRIKLIDKGNELSDLGKYNEAIKYYDKALEINSMDYTAWHNKGNALYNLGRYQEAIKCYDKTIEIFPRDDSAKKNREDALERLKEKELLYKPRIFGDWNESEKDFEDEIFRDKFEDDYWEEEKLRENERMIELEREKLEEERRKLEEEKKREEEREKFNNAIELAKKHQLYGNFEIALIYVDEALRIYPNDYNASKLKYEMEKKLEEKKREKLQTEERRLEEERRKLEEERRRIEYEKRKWEEERRKELFYEKTKVLPKEEEIETIQIDRIKEKQEDKTLVIEEHEFYNYEIKRLLETIDKLLEKLPKEVITNFANSSDFELYERVFAKYENLSNQRIITIDEDTKRFLKIVDKLLEKLPKEVTINFANSKDFELYEKIMDKIYERGGN